MRLDGDEARIARELAHEMGKSPEDVVRGAVRLLGMLRGLQAVHGVVRPVGDPRDGAFSD
jgi:hypothetical protein